MIFKVFHFLDASLVQSSPGSSVENRYSSCMASSSLAPHSDPVTLVWGQATEMFLGSRKLESDLKFSN